MLLHTQESPTSVGLDASDSILTREMCPAQSETQCSDLLACAVNLNSYVAPPLGIRST
jgi:hypothetical protein